MASGTCRIPGQVTLPLRIERVSHNDPCNSYSSHALSRQNKLISAITGIPVWDPGLTGVLGPVTIVHLNWEFGGVLNLRQGNTGVHLLNVWQLGQPFKEKAFIGFDIGGHYTQQIIYMTQQQMTLQNLRKLSDGFTKLGNLAATMCSQLDMGKNHGVKTQLLTVKDQALFLDQSRFSKSLYTSPAR